MPSQFSFMFIYRDVLACTYMTYQNKVLQVYIQYIFVCLAFYNASFHIEYSF